MNLHIGTATGIGGGAQPTPGPQIIGGGVGAGYCMLTLMEVVSFLGAHLTFGGGGGAQVGPTQAGAEAGITIGVGAGIAPIFVPAHTMPAAATTTRMNPRIPSFLTIPSSSFRQNSLYLRNSTSFSQLAFYFLTLQGIGGGGAIGTGPQNGLHFT